jgi:Protein of unknown function (DUF975)
MWTREDLKTRAKAVLKISYWKAFLVSIVIAIVSGGGSGSGSSIRNNFERNYDRGDYNSIINFNNGGRGFNIDFNSDMLPGWFVLGLGIGIVIILIIAAFRIFIGYILEVGGVRYFIQQAQNNADMNNLGYGFNRDRYKDIVITMLWRGVLNFLWFLLLIIPGIIKAYAYRMVPYILADNPNIGYKRAVELSVQMTNGEKFNIFVLDLSFIGWYLLGAIAFGIGGIFVNPYKYATDAELYLVLRQNAIDRGLCSYDEIFKSDMLI